MTEGEDYFAGFNPSVSASSSSSPSSSSGAAPAPSVVDPYAGIASMATPSRPPTTGVLGGGVASAPSSESMSSPAGSATSNRSAGPKYTLKKVTSELLDACLLIHGAGTFACLKAKVPGGSTCPTNHKSPAGQLVIQLGDLLVVEVKNGIPTRAVTALVMKDGANKVGEALLQEWMSDPVSFDDWTARFLQVDPNGGYDTGVTAAPSLTATSPGLTTPGKAQALQGLRLSEKVPFVTLSVDSIKDWKTKAPPGMVDALSKTIRAGVDLSDKTALTLGSLAESVSNDMTLLSQHLDDVQQTLGVPTRCTDEAGQTIFEIMDSILQTAPMDMASGVKEATAAAKQALELVKKVEVSPPLALARQMLAKGLTADNLMVASAAAHQAMDLHRSAATHLKAFIQEHKKDVDGKIDSIKALIAAKAPSPAAGPGWSGMLASQHDSADLLEELKAANRKIDDLERRLGALSNQFAQTSGDGVKLGNFTFTSFLDVKAWVLKKLEEDDFDFGAFVDMFVCLEFMCDDEITAESVGSKIKTAEGAGFLSLAEARILASFRNGLPTIFSGGKASTSGAPLPKLDKSTKWEDPKRFDSGMRHALSKFMGTKLDRIIQPLIESMSDPEARNLATLMLNRSTRFWTLFIDHLSKTQTDLTLRMGLKIEEAWNFATSEAKRILEDCNDPRFSALDAGANLKKHHANVAATVLYALLKCHMVMNEFVEANFKDHPSVGSERVKLLIGNMSANGHASQSDVIAKAQATAEKANTTAQAFQSRFDALISRLDKIEKSLAKKADK